MRTLLDSNYYRTTSCHAACVPLSSGPFLGAYVEHLLLLHQCQCVSDNGKEHPSQPASQPARLITCHVLPAAGGGRKRGSDASASMGPAMPERGRTVQVAGGVLPGSARGGD